MNTAEFTDSIDDLYKRLKSLTETKGEEYKRRDDNQFANFERGALSLGLTREQVLMVYLSKHLDSIVTYVKDRAAGQEKVYAEPISGRIDDAILYLLLLRGMTVENDRERDQRGPDWMLEGTTSVTGANIDWFKEGGPATSEDIALKPDEIAATVSPPRRLVDFPCPILVDPVGWAATVTESIHFGDTELQPPAREPLYVIVCGGDDCNGEVNHPRAPEGYGPLRVTAVGSVRTIPAFADIHVHGRSYPTDGGPDAGGPVQYDRSLAVEVKNQAYGRLDWKVTYGGSVADLAK